MIIQKVGLPNQVLISLQELVSIMQDNLRINTHPIPENMGGNLYCVDGVRGSAEAIFDLIEERAGNIKEKTEEKD